MDKRALRVSQLILICSLISKSLWFLTILSPDQSPISLILTKPKESAALATRLYFEKVPKKGGQNTADWSQNEKPYYPMSLNHYYSYISLYFLRTKPLETY